MTRIAIVSDSYPPRAGGGIATAHHNLARALARLGHHVEVFTFFDEPAETPEAGIHRFGSPAWWRKGWRLLNRWVFRLLAPGQAAYQFVDILESAIGARRMNLALRRFAPDVIVLSDQGAPGLWVSKRPGQIIGLISHHNPARFLNEPRMGRFSALDARLAIAMENIVLRKVDRVSAPSHYMKALFEQTYRFDGPLAVIPNVADLAHMEAVQAYDPREEMGLPPEAALVCLPSAGIRIKGADFVLEVLRKLAGPTVGFYLPGAVSAELGRDLAVLPPEVRLYRPGKLSHPKHIARLKACSFAIGLAINENYSMALVECTACGLPLAAWDSGGNADIVQDGVNGRLVAGFDVEALLATAREWLDDPATLAQWRGRTAAHARTAFDPDAVAAQYAAFFLERTAG